MSHESLAEHGHEIDAIIARLKADQISPDEEAKGFDDLVRGRGLGVRELARLVNKHPSYVSRRLRLFADPDLGRAVRAGKVAISTAERILSVREPAERAALIERAVEGGLGQKSVRSLLRERRRGASSEPAVQTPAATIESPTMAASVAQPAPPPAIVERATTAAIAAIEALLKSSERLSASEKQRLLDLSDQLYAFAKRRGPIW